MEDDETRDRYLLVGGGIASLAAAAFLIRDAAVPGERIRIVASAGRSGGAMVSGQVEGRPELVADNAVRSMDAKASACLWDLLGSITTLTDPGTTVLDEIDRVNRQERSPAEVKLVGADHRLVQADREGEAAERREMLAALGAGSDQELAGRRIDEVVPADLLETDFWFLWSTLYRLRRASSALDLRIALLRHPPDLPPPGLHRTRRSEYESIIRPLQQWLRVRGVVFTHGATVTDMDLTRDAAGRRRVTRLHLNSRGRASTIELGPRDHVLATLGSMAADRAYGDGEHSPALDRVHRDGSWSLWEAIARREPDFGRPSVFTSHVTDTAWLAFTVTSSSTDLTWHAGRLSGGRDGVGQLTFRDSPWQLTLAVPRQPHFTARWPEHTAVGYGLRFDTPGAHVPATLLEADGRQLLDELIGQLGIERGAATVRLTTHVVSTLLPYAGSPSAPRSPGDRPDPVPAASRNLAFLGQYVEIPGDLAFSMEYSVRSAMHAVYGLLDVDREIPAPYRAASPVGLAG
jgi:oleate hydratase